MVKFKNLVILLIVFSSLSIISCSSDDDGGDGGNAGNGEVTATVDGNAFTSLEIASVASLVSSQNVLTVQGSDADGKGIVLIINGYDGTGTYEVGGSNSVFVSASYVEANVSNPQASQAWQAPFDGNSAGSISISEQTSDIIKGTFEFTAQNSQDDSFKNVTNGSFNVELQIN